MWDKLASVNLVGQSLLLYVGRIARGIVAKKYLIFGRRQHPDQTSLELLVELQVTPYELVSIFVGVCCGFFDVIQSIVASKRPDMTKVR